MARLVVVDADCCSAAGDKQNLGDYVADNYLPVDFVLD